MDPGIARKLAAETFGTALLVFVGPGSAIATGAVLAGSDNSFFGGGDLLGISIAFGVVIAAMVYSIGKVSGCHINPAVTIALAATRRVPWSIVPPYVAAQLVGGSIGALGIVAVFGKSHGFPTTGWNEATVSVGSAFAAELIGTGILMFTILGVVDRRSPNEWAGWIIGMVVVGIIMVVGPLTVASLNPARSFGPSIAAMLSGENALANWGQIWLYFTAPVAGTLVAAFLYDLIAPDREEVVTAASVRTPEPELAAAR